MFNHIFKKPKKNFWRKKIPTFYPTEPEFIKFLTCFVNVKFD